MEERENKDGTCSRFPQKGDVLKCELCGLEFNCVVSCPCTEESEGANLECCGQEMCCGSK